MRGQPGEHHWIQGPSGLLEAMVLDPGTPGTRCALVCHPHPVYGGTMDNKVVTTVARALCEAGMPALRFNFRGVGASAGVFDGGLGESADADAAAEWCAARWPARGLVLAGFSFGAYVALKLAQRRPLSQLITIAPPVARFDFDGLAAPACPWLIVQGDADDVVEAGSVVSWAERFEPRPRLVMMAGVGHFFHGRLQELRDAVIDWVRSD
jgi:alpha/beta superfamily hydrolase